MHALRLDCRREKPGWQARLPGGLIEAQFAGTAVFFEERYYEVVAAREVGGAVSYYLDPWDDAIVLRRIVELSPEATAREAAERAGDVRRRSTASALVVLAPLVGLLPASYQESIERRYGLPASRATAWSAASLLAVASSIFLLALARIFATRIVGDSPDGWEAWLGPATYCMIESLLRLGAALAAGEANGTLPVVLLFGIVDLLRGRRRPTPPPAPDEVALEWEAKRARQATWVETFAPLWGLLDIGSQDRLAAVYDFDPRRASQLSILAAAFFGAAVAGLAGSYLASGAGGVFDLAALLAGGVVTLDALRRALVMLGGGRSGSVLAPFVRPLCAGALSASSPPDAR